MSLKSLPIPPVPEEIARVAHAVFPSGNVFIQITLPHQKSSFPPCSHPMLG